MAASATSEFVVAGAGPAGLTIARLLALRGRRVIVLDDERRNAGRLELLAPAAKRTIAALGLDSLLHDRTIAKPCLGIRRLQERNDYEDFLRHPDGIGYVIERARFDESLRVAALAAGAEILPLRVSGIVPGSRTLRVTSKAGTQGYLAVNGIVIDATGRAAAIARRRGATSAFRDRMIAELVEDMSAVLTLSETASAASWLDYRRVGASWSYKIHGPGGRVQAWRVRRSGARSDRTVRNVDASACILSRAAGSGWIAVGDAAMSFDPIASQGLFNALSSGLAAAGLLLSEQGLNEATANEWSGAVAMTFLRSEVGRADISGHLYSASPKLGSLKAPTLSAALRGADYRSRTGSASA